MTVNRPLSYPFRSLNLCTCVFRNLDGVGNSAELNKEIIQQLVEEKCVQMKKQQQQAMAAATQGIYELDTRGYAPRGLCPLGAFTRGELNSIKLWLGDRQTYILLLNLF